MFPLSINLDKIAGFFASKAKAPELPKVKAKVPTPNAKVNDSLKPSKMEPKPNKMVVPKAKTVR